MKRTIQFVGINRKGAIKTYKRTFTLAKVFTKVMQARVSTTGRDVDVSVTLDRWGRLVSVSVEDSRFM